MTPTPSAVFKLCDQLIRSGKIHDARTAFSAIERIRLNRPQKTEAARLARRLSLIAIGLKILHPLIHPVRDSDIPSEVERAEFANLLCLNGNVHEAFGLLNEISHRDGFLAKAWCHFETWDFVPAVVLLRKYLSLEERPYYFHAGLINLAEALSALREWSEANSCLQEAMAFANLDGQNRLMANALLVRARGLAEQGKWRTSDQDLLKAKSLLGHSPTADSFLIERQLIINRAHKDRDIGLLAQFGIHAREREQWESLRELDFQTLKIRFTEARFAKLYFGTPYPKYRERLLAEFQTAPPEHYVWGSSRRDQAHFDLAESKMTPQLQRFMWQMLSDFYQPQSLGRLFSGVFPSEHYNWRHSPNKVHQVISRMRRHLAKNKMPITIEQSDGFYQFIATDKISIRLMRTHDLRIDTLVKLYERFTDQRFTAKEACHFLRQAKTSTHRLLERAKSDGVLTSIGRGRSTQYGFIKNLSRKKPS